MNSLAQPIKVRNSNIEILRFALMIAIFLWHLLMHGCGFKDIGHVEYGYNIHLTLVLSALFAPAVNCFMFISGWFGIKFKIEKVVKLSIVCIISAFVCLVIRRTTFFSGGG